MTTTAPTPDSLLCPACGYDLRATQGDRCTECGLHIDRDALKRTAIPWAHRKSIGWLRALSRTIWQVTLDASAIRFEASRPQDLKSARRFRWIVALWLAAGVTSQFALAISAGGGFEQLAIQRPNPFGTGGLTVQGWLQDLIVPWSAGATLPPVLPLCMVVWSIFVTGAGPALIGRGWSDPKQTAGRALLLYAAAPLLWVALGLLLGSGFVAAAESDWLGESLHDVPFAVTLILGIVFIVSVAGGAMLTILRTAQWVMRIARGGAGTALLAAFELLGLWAYASLLCFGLLPWAIGYVWIAIDSLLP